MDSIVSKVRIELVNLAATYTADKHENVTISLISDFQRALFTILDQSIRIKDLKQSEELRDEMIQLFKDDYPTEPAWPYLNQLKKQDRCFAKLCCRFQHGAALYKSPSCQEHFMCEDHKSSPCIAKHGKIASQEHQAKNNTKNIGETALDLENTSTEHFIRGELGEKISEDEKSDETNPNRRLLGAGNLDKEETPEPIVEGAVGMVKPSTDFHYSWADDFDYDTGSSSGDESELDEDVVSGEEKNWQNADIGR
ncbi:hypothetical protein J3E71DRAFT_178415 [Bipolaris maydis]|nr:hypothetical protein J3E73DRAFT_192773 [Bipolaris maydis]KAJ6280803.1 hypothetical protein J3E71DRAFT_178415 [Bipolaris maydis]